MGAGAGLGTGISPAHAKGFGKTARRDAWWVEILPILLAMTLFTIYATWRAFEGKFYWSDPYLSPFYSPLIDPEHHWWPLSPALLILAGALHLNKKDGPDIPVGICAQRRCLLVKHAQPVKRRIH